MRFVVDTGVNMTLVSEEEWKKLQPKRGEREPKLKKNKQKFVLFGTNGRLECVGQSKVILEEKAGTKLKTIIYVIRGVSESLLGKTDDVRLGIVEFSPEGAESIRKMSP